MSLRWLILMFAASGTLVGAAPEGFAQERLDRFAGFIERLDQDGDGKIGPSEVPPRAKPFLERLARQAGLDTSQPIEISKLREAVRGQGADAGPARGGDDQPDRSSRSDANGKQPPGVPGFGAPDELEKVAGFDVPLDYVPLEEKYSDSVIRYVDGVMRRYDTDGNDILDPDEMKRVNWYSDPKPSDLNGDGSLSKEEMCERIARRWQRERPDKGSSSPRSSASSRESSTSASSSGSGSAKIRRYAQSLLKQYDKNKNGVLEKDEWRLMRGDPQKADTNNDGIVTLDELVVRLDRYTGGGGSSSTKPAASSPTAKRSSNYSKYRPSSRSSEARKSYRAKTALERLPRGLPDWFTRNDANGDGQISMSEYATSWSDSKAREFAGYDLDSDGVITPAEYLEASKKR